jgi:hypothetical protein
MVAIASCGQGQMQLIRLRCSFENIKTVMSQSILYLVIVMHIGLLHINLEVYLNTEYVFIGYFRHSRN